MSVLNLWVSLPTATFGAVYDRSTWLLDADASADCATAFPTLTHLVNAVRNTDGAVIIDLDGREATHLQPTSCYVCGHAPHPDSPKGHAYWSNAAAAAYFAAEDAGRSPAVYSGGRTAEGKYVDETRGR